METQPRTIHIFHDYRGKEPFTDWVRSLSRQHRARVFTRLDRVETGNMGDCKSLGGGVFELRLHFGPGYRIYFGEEGTTIILLLCGGDKSSQRKDIQRAKSYWEAYQTNV
jgi:putative addiction module killer protein